MDFGSSGFFCDSAVFPGWQHYSRCSFESCGLCIRSVSLVNLRAQKLMPPLFQAVRVELFSSGERAPEQLRTVSCSAGHLHRADELQRPGAAGADDGRGRWSDQQTSAAGPQVPSGCCVAQVSQFPCYSTMRYDTILILNAVVCWFTVVIRLVSLCHTWLLPGAMFVC